MRAPTLRGRLALTAVATTAIWVGLLSVGFNLLLSSQLHTQAGLLLRQRAAAAAATVMVDADGGVRVLDPRDDEALDTDIWIYAGKTALERPRAGRRVQAQADALAGRGERTVRADGSQEFYVLPVRFAGQQVATVVSAVSMDPYRNIARLARLGTAGLALLLLAGAYALTRILVGRALAPVQRMSAQAAQWSDTGEDARFGDAARPEELGRLAQNLDGVLDRLSALLRHEQQVSEELSHELRTPLSLLTAETDLLLARRRSAREVAAAVGRIAVAAGTMSEILETLLTTARSRTLGSAGRCRLEDVVAAAVVRAPAGPPVHVQYGDADLQAGVDAPVVERILAPLLDNAARYARTRVDVEVAAAPPYALVRVCDDGPGVDPALGEAAFDPGRRAADEHGGAGLGLALARRLARATGGDVVLLEGGFEVRLPIG